jgi:hypothetical protein
MVVQGNLQIEEVDGFADVCVRQSYVLIARRRCYQELVSISTAFEHGENVVDVSNIYQRFEAQNLPERALPLLHVDACYDRRPGFSHW